MLSEEAARRPRPGVETLRAHLLPLIGAVGAGEAPALSKEPNAYASHYASEVATFTWPDGRMLPLLLKYDDGEDTMAGGLLTVGPSYEARVYQEVLPRFEVTVPKCFGTWRDPESGSTVLVLEYLTGVHAHRTGNQIDGMCLAAGWAGRLHARAEAVVAAGALPGLNVYGEALYRHWAARTLTFERRTQAGRTWLPGALERIAVVIRILRSARQTLIHGDYYPDNMLYRDGAVSVFDWEQAAVAPGEIDLASLTLGWHPELLEAADAAYQVARWPGGAPAGFRETLEAARVFVLLRLLGEAAGWPSRPVRRMRVEMLRQQALRLGLL